MAMDRSNVPTREKAHQYMMGAIKWVALNTRTAGYDRPERNPIDLLLNSAREFYPEHYCVKNVYGAAEAVTGIGPIMLFARNGNPYSSSKHLERFNVRNLLAIAEGIKDEDRDYFVPILKRLADSQPDLVLSCDQLRDIIRATTHSKFAFCLKGFKFLPPNEIGETSELAKAKRQPSSTFCPNNQAGCTERALLSQVPYAMALQETLYRMGMVDQNEVLTILGMSFYDTEKPPIITYVTHHDKVPATLDLEIVSLPGVTSKSVKRLALFTQFTPCLTCTDAIINYPVPLEIFIASLSQYPRNVIDKVQFIDMDDVKSLRRLMFKGKDTVFFPRINEVIPKLKL